MASTLIIGIGSTGLNIIEEAQQWHYELTGKNKPGSNVEYLFFETDVKKKSRITPVGESDIKPVYLKLENHDATIKKLKSETDVENDWVPDVADILFNGDGAGGMPSYGRLALWDSANYMLAAQAINGAYRSINGDNNTKIFIVGTLTGGTGAGLCIDISYLTRKITNNDNIEGLFLLPDLATGYLTTGAQKIYLNSFSALAAIDYYTNPKNVYNVNWANSIGNISSKNPPYKYIQYLSTDFSNANAPFSFSELLRLAGFSLLMNYIDTDNPNISQIKDFVSAKRVDGYQHHNSLGLKIIQYPKRQMEELFALQEAEKIFRGWINQENYYENGEKKEITVINSKVERETSKDVESFVLESLDAINGIQGPDGVNLQENIELNVERIIKNEIGQTKDKRYVFSLFSSNISNSYYHVVKNNSYTMKDVFIDKVISYLDLKTDEFENLIITEKYLTEITKIIEKLILFYKDNYGISSEINNWDDVLKKYIDRIFIDKNKYSFILQKQGFYQFVLKELLVLLKINILISDLERIRESILAGKVIKTIKNKELPTLKYINKLKDLVFNSINNNNQREKSVLGRLTQIKANLTTTSKSIYYVYKYDDYLTDIQKAEESYEASPEKISSKKITQPSLWSYLNDIYLSIANNRDLYSVFTGEMVKQISSKSLFSDVKIIDIINSLNNANARNNEIKTIFTSNLQEIRKELPAFVRLRRTDQFTIASNALLFVFHDKKLDNNISILPNCMPAPMQHAYLDTLSFQDLIVFYQEYGLIGLNNNIQDFYNPIINSEFIVETKKHINKIFDEKTKMEHIPYLSSDVFKNNYLKK